MNKTMLILGGTGGIGEAVIHAFAGKYRIYATYFTNQAKADELSKVAHMIQCDLSDDNQVGTLLKRVNGVSVLVNAISPQIVLKRFLDTTQQEFNQYIDVMVKGIANVYRRIIPQLKLMDSLIINISSITAQRELVARMSAYAVAKAAQQRLCEYLIMELKGTSIRVVNLIPSFIETSALDVFPAKLLEFERMKLPGGEFIQPGGLAELLIRIVEDKEKYSHGTQLVLQNSQDIKND